MRTFLSSNIFISCFFVISILCFVVRICKRICKYYTLTSLFRPAVRRCRTLSCGERAIAPHYPYMYRIVVSYTIIPVVVSLSVRSPEVQLGSGTNQLVIVIESYRDLFHTLTFFRPAIHWCRALCYGCLLHIPLPSLRRCFAHNDTKMGPSQIVHARVQNLM